MALQVSVDSHINTPVARSSRTPETAAPARQPDHAIVQVPGQPVDTVKLSLSAHIHQLKSQGQSAKQIATSLGVDAKTVDTYLGQAAVKTAAPAANTAISASASAPVAEVAKNPAVATK